MMRKLIVSLLAAALFCTSAWADRELVVRLDPDENRVQTMELGYAAVTFRFEEAHANKAKVMVSVENRTHSEAILLFKSEKDERMLKRCEDRILFEKSYGGEKGYRTVSGCNYIRNEYELVEPAYTLDLFLAEVPTTGTAEIVIPFYMANHYHSRFLRRDKYRIFREDVIKFIVEAKDWTESDTTYVKMKKAVSDFKASLEDVRFCRNRMHRPSLEEQQKPYLTVRDSLTAVIDSILGNPWWMSQDLPHRSYSKLKAELQSVDFSDLVYDCGRHRPVHKCSYCPLSAEQIYHRLDDIYQKLHTGRIAKEDAVRTAKTLNSCWQQNKSRRRGSFYAGKIAEYYGRIINF
ncbi:MAG: hypothetical protein IAC23_08150 [Bacteroidetes bacterium]|uniref:Secreted protein n=1 Tax=Candidatus Cryptobacteroides merdavium TaxID=2840769 RepID=A0A9D9EIH2_9BACT|nr:hypothetical protein [Candidatus Cryptobacteroides merdavium]